MLLELIFYVFLYNPGSSGLSFLAVLIHARQLNFNTLHPPVDKSTKQSVPYIYLTKLYAFLSDACKMLSPSYFP
jgi:hypothetical protein